MKYQEIAPGNRLKSYVKCYYIYESTSNAVFEDAVFPSGCVEIIFNLGAGRWQITEKDRFVTTPPVELWGQLDRPLTVKSIGSNTMLGIRFFPFGAACFLNERIESFNNEVADFRKLHGSGASQLHQRLMETSAWSKRIELIEDFLWRCLSYPKRRLGKIELVSNVMEKIKRADTYDNIEDIASRYGITSRYLRKMFLQYTGLTPKLYLKINRFQTSLRMVVKKETTLTSIAYDCGYFDQSHFIKEFKSFTGVTPSAYLSEKSPITVALANS